MKTAFITGITGQDGSYLAELLLANGYEVHGLIRRSSNLNTSRLEKIYQEPDSQGQSLFLHYGDLLDSSRLCQLFREIKPNEIYNLAAQSHVRVSFLEPVNTSNVAFGGFLSVLEAARSICPESKIYQASSSEMFGATQSPQSLTSRFSPLSPYAIGKLASHHLANTYRESFGMYVVSGLLFNHESPRRGSTFVTQKLVSSAVRISQGKQSKVQLGNLLAERDWGYAPEYVVAIWSSLQRDSARDFALGTGVSVTVRDFADKVYELVGLDFENHYEIDDRYMRPAEVGSLLFEPAESNAPVDIQKLTRWERLAEIMVECEFEKLDAKQKIDSPKSDIWLEGIGF